MPTVQEMLETPAGRRVLAKRNPDFFDTYYCGMDLSPHRTRWLRLVEKDRRDKRKIYRLLMAPRDHGKTEACVTIAARAICLERDIRILFIAKAADSAKKRLGRVKALLESPKIQEDWGVPEAGGPFKPPGRGESKWTATQIYVPRTKASIDPTVEAVGSGGSITGGHFDLVICDDLEDSNSVFSASQRRKTRNWFLTEMLPMVVPGGTCVVIGTRKHHDDLYGHLIENSMWRATVDKAIIKWPLSWTFRKEVDPETFREEIVGVDTEGEYEVLWPSGSQYAKPIEYLLMQREQSHAAFAREFQHEVVDEATASFRFAWLQDALERGGLNALYKPPLQPGGHPVELVGITTGWDLALVTDAKKAERNNRDYTVGVTLGVDEGGTRYLLGLRRKRGLTPLQLRQMVIDEYNLMCDAGLEPHTVAVERNNFGELHLLGLADSDLPLQGHITNQNKSNPYEGVPALSRQFEMGRVSIPSGNATTRQEVQPLVEEFHGLGREAHDDIVMAWWIAETVLRQGGQTSSAMPRLGRLVQETAPEDWLQGGVVWRKFNSRTSKWTRGMANGSVVEE